MEQKKFKFGSDRYNNFCFRSPKCLKQIKNNDDLLCNECDEILLKLQNNCIRSEKRVEASKKVNFRHDIALSSPTLAQNKMEMLSQNIRLDTMKKARAKFIHKKILEKSGVVSDFDHELIFPSNLEELGENFFDKEKIEADDLARYLFRESCSHARTSRLSEKKSVSIVYLFIFIEYFIS